MHLAAAGIAILAAGIFSPAWGQSECPPGSRKVKIFATGEFRCQPTGRLDTRSVKPRALGSPGTPGSPGAPGKPAAPREAASPAGEKGDCGLQRWGCEEACRQTYLKEATASSGSVQRASVKRGACVRVCGQQFPCKVKAPEGALK